LDEPHLDLSAETIDSIVNFLGYGRASAPVCFIGIEEGIGDMTSNEAKMNLKARGHFEDTMDLYCAHLRLLKGGKPIGIENKLPSTQVWRWMAKIMLAFRGCDRWNDPELAKDYARFQLGRNNGETFMTELSPIPAKNAGDKNWMQWFTEHDSELARKLSERRDKLKELLKQNSSSLVICYGSGRQKMDEFAKFLEVQWQPVCADTYISANSKMLLLPFFGNGRMSSKVIEELLRAGYLK